MSFALAARATPTTLPRHPVFHGLFCINRKQRLKPCEVCKTVCPKGVYLVPSGSDPDWSKCSNCGLCSASCPARCITPSPADIESYVFAVMDSTLPSIACAKSRVRADISVDCLATVPWEFIAYLAMTHNVVLHRGDCRTCSWSQHGTLLNANLDKVRIFHGDEDFARHVHVRDSYKEDATDEPSRFDSPVFSGGEKRGQRVPARVVAELRDRDFCGLLFRRLLANLVRSIESDGFSYTVELPATTGECYGCGICADLCPHSALQLEVDHNEKDPVCTVSATAWKCVACGTCSAVCRRGGMSEPRPTQVKTLECVPIGTVKMRYCERCGCPIPPDEQKFCALCVRILKRASRR